MSTQESKVSDNTEKYRWDVVKAFYRQMSFVNHHMDSFAYFINTIVPSTVTTSAPFSYETENYIFSYRYINSYLHKPCITEADGTVTELWPYDARLRNLTYASPLFIQIEKTFTNKLSKETTTTTETINPGNVPIVVKSIACRLYNATEDDLVKANECIYEQGGYFIVNGTEKIVVGMERMSPNMVYVFPNKNDNKNEKDLHKEDIYAEISSLEEKAKKAPVPFYIHQTICSSLGRKTILAGSSTNYFKKEYPIGILLKALGCFDFKEKIISHHLFSTLEKIKKTDLNTLLEYIEEDCAHITTRLEAFKYLNKISSNQSTTTEKIQLYINAILQKEFLPHVGIDEYSYPKKAELIIYAIQKLLLCSYRLIDYDDHDHYKNKRVDTTGILYGNIFKQSWAKLDRELQLLIKKKMDNGNNLTDIVISQLINNTYITKDLNHVLATGNWGIIRSSRVKTGVSQLLNRFNYQSYLSHCRRLINPMPKNSILSKPRQLHNSSWGYVCQAETPEGHSIGLVKNQSFLVHISLEYSDLFILELLHESGMTQEPDGEKNYTIIMNGKIVGYYINDHPYELVRECKIKNVLPFDTGVYPDHKKLEIHIFTDSGRIMRPLLVVNKNKDVPELALNNEYLELVKQNKKTWIDMVNDGIIEFLDAGEQEHVLICDDITNIGKDEINYTHAEIHPVTILGVCANTTPFSNHDPAARITYNSSMAKQSVSVPMTNYKKRMDTLMHVLHNPQKPICKTKPMDEMLFTELPQGTNAIVAVTTYGGFNMEDSIILNRSSVQRGMFRSTFYKTYKDTETKVIGADEKFGIPIDEKNIDKLQIDGIVGVGTYVKEGDIIIGKISSSIGSDGKPMKPKCISIKSGDEGIVDNVLISVNPDGTKMVKVRVRTERVPEVGDKFAAVHSQKGVIGAMYNQEDMPFNQEGICPDMIINPHSQPSRMTVGHMLEISGGKYGAASGKYIDATAFEKRNLKEIEEGLLELGFQRHGYETLYNGTTGEMMQAQIYMGSCYYNRLKHMVRDKMHGRGSRGPNTTLTHQPTEGKAREGGLRTGEMERDAYIGLGAANILQQRLMILSDEFETHVCEDCGLFAIGNPEKKIYICRACKSKKIVRVQIPYATKQLFLSLYALGIAPRLQFK